LLLLETALVKNHWPKNRQHKATFSIVWEE